MFCRCLNPSFTGTYLLSPPIRSGAEQPRRVCLNPSFTGTYLLSDIDSFEVDRSEMRLNPSFTGTYLLRNDIDSFEVDRSVLILLLLELTF